MLRPPPICTLRRVLVGMAMMLALAAPAAAQATDEPTGLLIGGGVSFLYDKPVVAGNPKFASGFTVDAQLKSLALSDALEAGLIGQFGYNRLGGTHINSLEGGLRVAMKGDPRFTPYFQFTAGLWNCRGTVNGTANCGPWRFAIEPGGGIDFPLTSRLNLRGAFGYLRVRKDKGFFTEMRISAGLSYRFGAK